MSLRRIALLTMLSALGILGSVGGSPRCRRAVLDLDIHHNETHFPPGGVAEYWFDIHNVGDAAPRARSSSPSNCPKA